MPINFKCKCGQVLTSEDEHAGMQAKCPKCSELITIPPPEREESKCPECGKPMEPDAVICMECGFNRKSGRKLTTGAGFHTARKTREEEEIPDTSPIISSFGKSFSFPLQGSALAMMISMPILYILLHFLPFFGGIIYFGFFYSCLIDIMRTAAGGPHHHVEWPNFSEAWSEMVMPAIIVFFAAFLAIVIPLGAAVTFLGGTALVSKLGMLSGLKVHILPGLACGSVITGLIAIFCASYFPMTLTIAGIYQAFGASLNPVILFRAISKILKEYALVAPFVYIFLAMPFLVNSILSHIPPIIDMGLIKIPFWNLFAPAITFYFWGVASARLGFMAYYNREKLGW